jgi:hypothetical protein
VAMSVISVREILSAPALRLWCRTLNIISCSMARGHATCRSFTTLQK